MPEVDMKASCFETMAFVFKKRTVKPVPEEIANEDQLPSPIEPQVPLPQVPSARSPSTPIAPNTRTYRKGARKTVRFQELQR
jgi:hypothetical protein